jgi:hypothetical protein
MEPSESDPPDDSEDDADSDGSISHSEQLQYRHAEVERPSFDTNVHRPQGIKLVSQRPQ